MPGGGYALPGLPFVRPAFNLFTTLDEAGVGGLKIPGGANAYRGYSTVRSGSPDKAQRAASGKTVSTFRTFLPFNNRTGFSFNSFFGFI
ncbi:hypothetical protein CEG88_22600 [Klebsiella aerogenes]|nr:hypothetical protein CEG88_22600 [Klebsiella aerogenes]